MKILIFTEGTVLMPASGKNVSREERVQQVVNHGPSVDNFADIQNVLTSNDFPKGKLFYRKDTQEYIDVLKEIMPDVLVEDDCKSIGGAKEMISTYMDENLRAKIKVIVVKEFGGIDHLPDII